MRVLHRHIGFFIFGFIVIYAISGIALIFRDSDFLKYEKKIKVTLPTDTKSSDIGSSLKIRDFKILETQGDVIYFKDGSFNTSTGEAEYTVKELIFPINKLVSLHKIPSKNPLHWFSLAIGILLFFMAVSSFWMFTTRSKQFRRYVYCISRNRFCSNTLTIYLITKRGGYPIDNLLFTYYRTLLILFFAVSCLVFNTFPALEK